MILMADSAVAGKCARERAFVHGESAHNIIGKIVAAEYCDANLVFKAFSRDAAAYVIRVQVGQFDCTRDDVMMIPQVVAELI